MLFQKCSGIINFLFVCVFINQVVKNWFKVFIDNTNCTSFLQQSIYFQNLNFLHDICLIFI
jgi:hypothetical protein